MSDSKIIYCGIVYQWHCDHTGHMNVMWYTGKFDEACWQLLAMLGLRPSRFAEDGTGMVAVEQRIEYKRELHAGNAVRIQSSVLDVTDKSIHMLHRLVDDVTASSPQKPWSSEFISMQGFARQFDFPTTCAKRPLK
jgi:acyl-CoA thioester hydrolase